MAICKNLVCSNKYQLEVEMAQMWHDGQQVWPKTLGHRFEFLSYMLRIDLCDKMSILLFQYLSMNSKENLPNRI